MIHSFEEILEQAGKKLPGTLAVAAAQDAEVLRAVRQAVDRRLVRAILVGDAQKIRRTAADEGVFIGDCAIVDEPDPEQSCRTAVGLAASGQANVLMKGLVDTSLVLRAILDKESGLRAAKTLSHVALFDVPGFSRMLLVTDAAMNIHPDVETKKQIIENALVVAGALGNAMPNVACLCAVEKVNPKMPATLDAAELVRMNKDGELTGCVVSGPFALDNAISEAAARHKGIADPAAGKADVLLVPQIEAGNVLYKSLVFFARAKNAGIILGARVPVVVTSRADSDETKLHSLALDILVADYQGGLL
jgi:phosphate butyryltransferase